MKRFIIISVCIACACVAICCSFQKGPAQVFGNHDVHAKQKSARHCPVKPNTTKIIFGMHTNSGIAIQSKHEISRDSIVWDYYEMRNGCHLRDVIENDGEDYDRLVSDLSQVKFRAKDMHDTSAGGDGYWYSFEAGAKPYFSFNSSYDISGDFEKLYFLIANYIKGHPTKAEELHFRLSLEPHDRAEFGEFETLPKELEPYRLKK